MKRNETEESRKVIGVGGMIRGKQENLEKTLKIATLLTTCTTLSIPRFELKTSAWLALICYFTDYSYVVVWTDYCTGLHGFVVLERISVLQSVCKLTVKMKFVFVYHISIFDNSK